MFIGHFVVAFGIKHVAPEVGLGSALTVVWAYWVNRHRDAVLRCG
jgi:hypothetical protein